MPAVPADLLTLPLSKLVQKATAAVSQDDAESLAALDQVLFYHLFEAIQGRDETALDTINDAVFEIVESTEALGKPEPAPSPSFLARWRAFSQLADAVRTDTDMVDDAARVLERKHVREILGIVDSEGHTGVTSGELAARRGIKAPQVSMILRVMEDYRIIERHSHGGKTFVSVGIVGDILLERERERPHPEFDEAEIRKDFGDNRPMPNPLSELVQ